MMDLFDYSNQQFINSNFESFKEWVNWLDEFFKIFSQLIDNCNISNKEFEKQMNEQEFDENHLVNLINQIEKLSFGNN